MAEGGRLLFMNWKPQSCHLAPRWRAVTRDSYLTKVGEHIREVYDKPSSSRSTPRWRMRST